MRNGCRTVKPQSRAAKAGWAIAIAIVVGCGIWPSNARAQDIDSPAFDDLKSMVALQQEQIRQMQDQLSRPQQPAPAQASGVRMPPIPGGESTPASLAANPAPAVQPGEPAAVGGDPATKPEFRNGLFLWFATPNNAFTMHIGGWAQLDNVWFAQSPSLMAAPIPRTAANSPGIAGGVPGGGIGDLQDGEYLRRVRLFFEGTFWENGEYRLIPAFENDQFQSVGLDQVLVRSQGHSLLRLDSPRPRQRSDRPRRRHDGLQPLDDVHGAIGLFRSDRIEPEFRHRPVDRRQRSRSAHDLERLGFSIGHQLLDRPLFRRRPRGYPRTFDGLADLRR